MVLLYVSAAWVGGILTLAVLWGLLGPALALAAAPFGASAVTVGAACLAGLLLPDSRDRSSGGTAVGWHQAR